MEKSPHNVVTVSVFSNPLAPFVGFIVVFGIIIFLVVWDPMGNNIETCGLLFEYDQCLSWFEWLEAYFSPQP